MKILYKTILASFALGFNLSATAQVTTFSYTGTIDTYTVPADVSRISIQAYGAQGGNDNGGLGAGIYGEFDVTPGTVFNVVVGQQGLVNNCGGPDASGGGGGGSFVWDPTDADFPLVAAGGGGGGNENWGGIECRAGVDGQAGNDGTSGAEGLALGGVGGEGGAGDAPSGTGSGGGGWLSPGQNSTWGDGCTGGTILPTFFGGEGASGFGPGGQGGFGGGGGAVCGSGGGGGFSGGAGGNGSTCRAGGGGGGSYNAGTEQSNATGVRTGNGEVIITVLCDYLTVSVSDYEVCLGEPLTFSATSSNEGTITWSDGIENGIPFTPDAPGTIIYTASSSDEADCDATVEITVFENPIVDSYTTTDEIAGGDGEIDITVIGGTPGYVYDWNNDGTGDFDDAEDLTGLVGGTYTVIVQDENGCEISSDYTVNSQVGIKDFNLANIQVYPNPTQSSTRIEVDGNFEYSLNDLRGKSLLSGNAVNQTSLDLSDLSKGTYLLLIHKDGEVYQGKVLKF